MLCSYWAENLCEFEEGFADNTQVLSKSVTKKTCELSANNQLSLRLYSTYLSADATSLLAGEIILIKRSCRAFAQQPLVIQWE